jgi:hypothetical protein
LKVWSVSFVVFRTPVAQLLINLISPSKKQKNPCASGTTPKKTSYTHEK